MSNNFTREPWEWGPSVAQELREQLRNQQRLGAIPPVYGTPPTPTLTEADVRRIVREEMESSRPVPSVIDVTPEEVRRWTGGKP